MRITYDPKKRALALVHRGLDFEDGVHVFAGRHLQIEDDRRDYGETRWQTIGRLNDEGGDGRLDRARRRAPRHLDEEVQCP